ncbi:hypothetical protein ABZ330_16445 [Streptomyces sp. NPDC006172]|uniref:hypothetical protein n=1 Tax=Streptomyces sp. NPDC006172 TaxID=3154470 RepID=UPI0034052D25
MGLIGGELSWTGPFVPADEDVPHEGALPDLYGLALEPGLWQGRYASRDGMIVLRVDQKAFDFHIDAKAGHKASDMRAVLEVARSRGLEPLDEDECEPEILEDGTVRIYLAPVDDAEDVEPELPAVEPKLIRQVVRRTVGSLALAASIVTALLLPSPMQHHYPDALTHVFGQGEVDTSDESPLPPNEGEMRGPGPQGHTAKQAPASESLGSPRRLGTTSHRSAGRGKADWAHAHNDVHRLRGGQVQFDRLAKPHGAGRSLAAQ